MIHGPARHTLTEQDWEWLTQLATAGCNSILGFSFYSLDTWSRILSLGYADITLRLWHDRGTLPHPGIYYAQYENYIWTLRGMCQVHDATLAVAPINECNLEITGQTAAEVAQWYEEWALRMTARMPNIELLTPSISPTYPGAWQYLQELRSAFRHGDTLSSHFYWQNDADLNPRASWSPEWWHEQFPTMPQRLTEVGGADGTSREWRYQTYYETLSRFHALPYVRSQHVFVMSSDDSHWAQLGHTYDPRIVEILSDVAQLGEVPMVDDPRIQQLLNQNAEITAALIAHLKGNDWDGADSVAGHIIALTGKTLDELGLARPLG